MWLNSSVTHKTRCKTGRIIDLAIPTARTGVSFDAGETQRDSITLIWTWESTLPHILFRFQ
jgi:hypothetical protein